IIADGQIPGTFQSNLSSAKITSEKDFPIFDVKLKVDEFEKGEDVVSGSKRGSLQSWNNFYGYLRVSSIQDFEVGDFFIGESSGTRG